ncbi:AAA family ATPase [Archangium lipolyticum]|uniref:hypothetical protein n=1 Tax=Archangium lipolyticum TaxID=2970465 RepID=UPI00214A47D8|nr:hypothetical protein [Archangium lipolyticum]
MAPQPPFPPQPPGSPPESPLQKHLRRMMEALAEGQKHHARWMEMWARYEAQEREKWARHHGKDWEARVDHQVRKWERWGEQQARRWEEWGQNLGKRERRKLERQLQRQMVREQRRALKRQRRNEEAEPLVGWVFAMASLVLTGMAFLRPQMWWLVFVALGLGISSASILGRARQHRLQEGKREGTAALESEGEEASGEPEKTVAPGASEDPRKARVDTLCDKLLAELRSGPGVLREVVHQPEQTVEGLRKSCHELVRRERELRSLSSPEDERRLEDERAQLSARVESERDAVVKERLEGALRLLDEQRRQRAELATAASRLEAEHMRLYYTLENLYTQVLRVRSADAASADVAGAGLRRSVEQLGLEMDAVAEAVEEVHRDAPPRERVPTR